MGEVVCLTVPTPLSLWDLQFFVETEVIGTVICVHCDDQGRPWMLLQLSPNPRQPLIVTVKNFLVQPPPLWPREHGERSPPTLHLHHHSTMPNLPLCTNVCKTRRRNPTPSQSHDLCNALNRWVRRCWLEKPGWDASPTWTAVPGFCISCRRRTSTTEAFPCTPRHTVGEMQPAPPWQMPRNGRTDGCFSFGGIRKAC